MTEGANVFNDRIGDQAPLLSYPTSNRIIVNDEGDQKERKGTRFYNCIYGTNYVIPVMIL